MRVRACALACACVCVCVWRRALWLMRLQRKKVLAEEQTDDSEYKAQNHTPEHTNTQRDQVL